MRFRPCIDLHDGVVKQIVGGSFSQDATAGPRVNFAATDPPSHFARMYRRDGLLGGHVIMLGSGNETAAQEALAAWPGGMQIGGGITAANAREWLDRGASAVIITSYAFRAGIVDYERLKLLVRAIGRNRIVLDLSCRPREDGYYIVSDRWTRFTECRIEQQSLDRLAGYCDEFLVHAADVEGLCGGIDEQLVTLLGEIAPIPTTYAGGVRDMSDVRQVEKLGKGGLDITVGSALDIFGGAGIRYEDMVALTRRAGPRPVSDASG